MTRDISQLRVIRAPANESALVVAPPGYGKTYVMAKRISYLRRAGHLIFPKRLLGLTFTNAAAGEMADRIHRELGAAHLDGIDLGTIHSFCYRALKAYGNYVDAPTGFSVLGESGANRLKRELVDKHMSHTDDEEERRILDKLDTWLGERLLKRHSDFEDADHQTEFELVYREYTTACQNKGVIDFDHILIRTLLLFINHPAVLELYRAAYHHVLVDEFQDTNPLQFEIIALLVEGHPNQDQKAPSRPVFLFADTNQAIYEFLGATPENVSRAQLRFNCTEFRLLMNHRTNSPMILELSSCLRPDEEALPSTTPATFVFSPNPVSEAEEIAAQISVCEAPLHQIAVVAHAGWRLNDIRACFAREDRQIPFVFIPDFQSRNVEKRFLDLFQQLRSISPRKQGHLTAIIRQFLAGIQTEPGDEEVLSLMLEMARQYDYRYPRLSLAERGVLFVNETLLEINWANLVRQRVTDRVFVSTIHGVKGLEFDEVFICGLENYHHPNTRICRECGFGKNQTHLANDLEEPSRVLYVAITRSIRRVRLYAVQTNNYGKRRSPSCLIAKLSPHLETERLRPGERLESLICGRYRERE